VSSNRNDEGYALKDLGTALANAGRYGEAVAPFQEAAAIFRETRNPDAEAAALDNLGAVLYGVGQFAEAINAFQDAVTLFREIGDRRGEDRLLERLETARDARQVPGRPKA